MKRWGLFRLFLWREWRDQRRNKTLIVLYSIMFLLGAGLPVLAGSMPIGVLTSEPELAQYLALLALSEGGAFAPTRYLLRMSSAIYLVVALGIVTTTGSYSVVGERLQRTLEPLLSTPIGTSRLLAAKLSAICVPAVLLTWASAAAAAVTLSLGKLGFGLPWSQPDVHFFSIVLGLSPLIAWITGGLSMHVSMRQSDPQAATQITGMIIAPLVLMAVGLSATYIGTSLLALWIGCGILLAIAVALHLSLVRRFDRAGILALL